MLYDISDPKRLYKINKIVKGYGITWQLSVFLCILRNIDRVRLENDIKEIINIKDDQVLILDLGHDIDKLLSSISVIGLPLPQGDDKVIFV
ncbi:MAG: CRISPR-associated endonuclease Cas2 [Deltaproteobacteria bacterium]|nr:CRISPR-associated endonuclease Cas2 [Deltaproteobacteria bacterium]